MNEIINNFLLAGNKFMPEMDLQDLHKVLVDNWLKIKKEQKKLIKKQSFKIYLSKRIR